MQNLITVSYRMRACKGSQEIFGTLVTRPLRTGRVAEH